MPLTNFTQPVPIVSTVAEGITANPGGGQAGATVLTSRYNHAGSVATAGDSVILPPHLVDLHIFVSNDGANAMAVFPYAGQQIGTGAINASVSIPAGKTANFVGTGTIGKWRMILSA